MTETEPLTLTAYEIHQGYPLFLVPAKRERAWMDASDQGFVNRCLPLLIANQAGWWVTTREGFEATWNGGPAPADVKITANSGPAFFAAGHFGVGTLTISLPWIFRTPPGWNLWVRGPANSPKERLVPLEGIVETDWAPMTFTMNWRFTEPGAVTFYYDEPLCHLVPFPRRLLESFEPEIVPLAENHELAASLRQWEQSRSRFLVDQKRPGSEAWEQGWQKDYFRGEGAPPRAHQTKVNLREFRRVERGGR